MKIDLIEREAFEKCYDVLDLNCKGGHGKGQSIINDSILNEQDQNMNQFNDNESNEQNNKILGHQNEIQFSEDAQ